jgi:hypothetical protein
MQRFYKKNYQKYVILTFSIFFICIIFDLGKNLLSVYFVRVLEMHIVGDGVKGYELIDKSDRKNNNQTQNSLEINYHIKGPLY